jgi:acyl-CoA synthetase (AMP-forming)/AMP-acid ligase II
MVYRSPHPPLDIPAVPVADFVLARAAARAGRPAIVDSVTGRTITYGELPGLVDRAAAGLHRLGIRQGDVCGVFSPNAPEYMIAVLAVARLGAVSTTTNPLNTRDELARQLADARVRLLFTITSLAPVWTAAVAQASVEHVFTFDEPFDSLALAQGRPAAAEASSARPFGDLLGDGGAPPHVDIVPGDLVALPYSSGTTGFPKGVMLTHRNLVANMLQMDATGHFRHDADTAIAFLPFFHIYGLVVIGLLGLWSGATLVVMPRFELNAYLDLVERYGATMLHVVPPVVIALAKHPSVEGRTLSSVRKLFSGAAPLGSDAIEQCTRRLGCVLQQGYGMTEASPGTHVTSDDPAHIKYGSVGQVTPNTECRVVDPETGHDVAPGSDGEIWVRGPQVMRGYLNHPDDTRATVDGDGWLHTGDIGHADADGHFYVVDRLKELIKFKCFQVAPAELESVLLSHPSIADAAVVPLKDDEAGEVPRAFVVLKAPATAEDLTAYVAQRVAPYKKIRRVDFVDAIPKSPSGKILRRLLRDVAITV